jgi:NitT/TauT family transport system permease protein
VSAVICVTAAVVVEFISANSGIGKEILRAASQLQTVRIFLAVTYVAVVGLATFALMILAERLAIPWHVSQRHAEGGEQ